MFEKRQTGTFPQQSAPGSYHRPVPVSAHDIAAALRAQSPGLPAKKLHQLLYYCQGHHLAWFGEPLFTEAIEAWDMGPVVADLWRAEKRDTASPLHQQLGNAELNTVGYVLSRYGGLTGKDLEILSHGEDPWREADQTRQPGGAVRIEHDAIARYFTADHEEHALPRSVIQELRRRIAEQPPLPPSSGDCLERVRAMRDEAAAKLGIR